jgi:hypothetical protein
MFALIASEAFWDFKDIGNGVLSDGTSISGPDVRLAVVRS